ncbi:MAG: hypothetical protein K6F51_10310 [Acetatifactor sp.]|nr:hypothetical protein [Acetatifactor sp.]
MDFAVVGAMEIAVVGRKNLATYGRIDIPVSACYNVTKREKNAAYPVSKRGKRFFVSPAGINCDEQAAMLTSDDNIEGRRPS